MKVVAIIQARMDSTRLHGKVLRDVSGKPMLWHMINRLRKSKEIDSLVVATSELERDDVLEDFSRDMGIDCFRGSEDDVLSRYYYTAKNFNADVIVRLTGDCPLIDPRISDHVIRIHVTSDVDYTSNTIKRTFPRGLDTEVFNFQDLEKAFKEAKKKYEREHVTPYIWENPEIFKLKSVEASGKLRRPDIRITVDTEEDLKLIREIFSSLYKPNKIFYTEDVIALFDKRPELLEINKTVKQKD